MADILIIDDEKAIRKTLTEILSFEGYKIDEASDGEEGLKTFKDKTYDVVLCDIKMPKLDGIEFLQKAGEINPDIPIIMISGHGNIETAVEAVKKGAYDYISKPPDLNRLLITIRNALDKNSLNKEAKVLRKKISGVQEMIGESDPIKKIKETVDKVAPTDARVLITGENGVGKELVARWLHGQPPIPIQIYLPCIQQAALAQILLRIVILSVKVLISVPSKCRLVIHFRPVCCQEWV